MERLQDCITCVKLTCENLPQKQKSKTGYFDRVSQSQIGSAALATIMRKLYDLWHWCMSWVVIRKAFIVWLTTTGASLCETLCEIPVALVSLFVCFCVAINRCVLQSVLLRQLCSFPDERSKRLCSLDRRAEGSNTNKQLSKRRNSTAWNVDMFYEFKWTSSCCFVRASFTTTSISMWIHCW